MFSFINFPTPLPVSRNDYVMCTTASIGTLWDNRERTLKNYEHFSNGQTETWNWTAFLLNLMGFGSIWLLAKRLYLMAFAYICLTTLMIPVLLKICAMILQKSNLILYSLPITVTLWQSIFGFLLARYGDFIHFWWLQKWKEKHPFCSFVPGIDFLVSSIFIFTLFLTLLTGFPFSYFIPLIAHHMYYEQKRKQV